MKDLSNDNIIHVKKGNIEYLQFRKLLEYKDKIVHCYTLKGNSNDYKEINKDNYSYLYKALNLNYDGFTKIEYQAHSDLVEVVEEKNQLFTDIDGLVTDKKGISLSLRFADCTPIFMYDKEKNIIGNIHSGWRGTTKKIVQKGVLKMIEKYNSSPKDIICCIGPSIGKCHFEVGEDVKKIFTDTFSYLLDENEYIKKGYKKEDGQKYYIDTNIINRKLLEEIGIRKDNIIQSNICTVCNSEYMHSYRVDKDLSGRNTSIIGLL